MSFIFHVLLLSLVGELKFHGIVIRDNRDNPWILENFVIEVYCTRDIFY